ncbi:YegP family protein [Roseibium salinum]|nr:YegP family protein [Roseibium salinum]
MFNLKASNGQVIGTSETYSSAASRDNGIESVKKKMRLTQRWPTRRPEPVYGPVRRIDVNDRVAPSLRGNPRKDSEAAGS